MRKRIVLPWGLWARVVFGVAAIVLAIWLTAPAAECHEGLCPQNPCQNNSFCGSCACAVPLGQPWGTCH